MSPNQGIGGEGDMTKTKVQVRDADGTILFNRLWDDGGPMLRFESGHGFVTREDVERKQWTIRKGWE